MVNYSHSAVPVTTITPQFLVGLIGKSSLFQKFSVIGVPILLKFRLLEAFSSEIVAIRQDHRMSNLHASLSLGSLDAPGVSNDVQEPGSNSEQAHDSHTESASSRETWPIDTSHSDAIVAKRVEKGGGKEHLEQQLIRSVSTADNLSLHEVAKGRVEVVAERMVIMPDVLLEELKSALRLILEGTGGSQHREELLHLQMLVQSRSDLTTETLARAHQVQLEILVAINTGIQAFLHPNISLPQSHLIEVFVYKRCRNIACQSALPADDCICEVCSSRDGFCNLCMCVICNKFDFQVNTCRWIGCDLCSHWTHTDCAIRIGKIAMGQSSKSSMGRFEMLFRCQACNWASELLGWVKDVFQQCSPGWDREALVRELDFISRIFRRSEDIRGRMLLHKCEDLIEKLKGGVPESTACRTMLLLFQELEMDPMKNTGEEETGRLIAPLEACNRIVEVVQEACRKMEMVAEEKMYMCKRAHLAVEVCHRELEEKAIEVAELKMERQMKKQQVEELESIARLKQAEADMFQVKATEARREAERLQNIVFAKSEKTEEEYASRYLKARLEEAEMEKQYLFEKIKHQESQKAQRGSSSGGGDPSEAPVLCKMQDFLKNVYPAPPKLEGPA